MKQTVFVFGRTPALAFVELQSLFPSATLLTPAIALLNEGLDESEVIARLGGTVKILEVVAAYASFTQEAIAETLLPYVSEGKITFGISMYGQAQVSPAFLRGVKECLDHRSVAARYIETKHEEALASVVVSKQHVREIVAVYTGGQYIVGITKAVQHFESWNKRDFSRPASDPHRGMLPPKVARMIVNISLARVKHAKPVFLDPFCGVGTVLTEALLSGAAVIGCDISEKTVKRAEKNIAWARAEYGLLPQDEPVIRVGDATHVSEFLSPNSIDAIATEPFLGEPVILREGERIEAGKAKNILKGLEKLYIGSLKEWAAVLKPGARVVMAMPTYVTDRGLMGVKKVVDRCEKLGYTLFIGPVQYSRPHAMVRREFYVFEKKKE